MGLLNGFYSFCIRATEHNRRDNADFLTFTPLNYYLWQAMYALLVLCTIAGWLYFAVLLAYNISDRFFFSSNQSVVTKLEACVLFGKENRVLHGEKTQLVGIFVSRYKSRLVGIFWNT